MTLHTCLAIPCHNENCQKVLGVGIGAALSCVVLHYATKHYNWSRHPPPPAQGGRSLRENGNQVAMGCDTAISSYNSRNGCHAQVQLSALKLLPRMPQWATRAHTAGKERDATRQPKQHSVAIRGCPGHEDSQPTWHCNSFHAGAPRPESLTATLYYERKAEHKEEEEEEEEEEDERLL